MRISISNASLSKGQVPRLRDQGAARVGHDHHRTSRRNRSGVHRPQPQVVSQKVTEGRPFAHGHGQTGNGVVLPHSLGGSVSLNLVATAGVIVG
jgi:hypothetical protein